MPAEVTIGGNNDLFIGTDKTIRLELVDETDTTKSIDMGAWVMVFDVRKSDTAPDPPIVTKTPSVSGVFNTVRASNLQRAYVMFTDDEMNLFKQKTYRWSWKRMDAGSEDILGWGNFTPKKATAP